MASAMHHTMQTCQNLVQMTQSQILDEDKIDPFPARTTLELEEMLDACRRTKEILSRESLIYSNDADFSKYSDSELVAMNAFVRENSRMLSIILAGGSQHFWNGQGSSAIQELKNMYPFIDDKVKEYLLIDTLMETLEIKTKYGKKDATYRSNNPATHPDLLAFTAIDASRAPTSQESLRRLAGVCEQFAEQCRTISQIRVLKMEDRNRKMAVHERLVTEVNSVLPMLRQHVLKIGLSKTQLQNKDERLKELDQKINLKNESQSHKLTSLFTYKSVEDAHRAVEDCRERLMQELLFRRSKVERRLQREEEMELERERVKAEQLKKTGIVPGAPTHAYHSLELDETIKKKGSSQNLKQEERGSASPQAKRRGPGSDDSPTGGTTVHGQRASQRSQDSKEGEKMAHAKSASRSPSPKTRAKASAKGKAKDSAPEAKEEAKESAPAAKGKAKARGKAKR